MLLVSGHNTKKQIIAAREKIGGTFSFRCNSSLPRDPACDYKPFFNNSSKPRGIDKVVYGFLVREKVECCLLGASHDRERFAQGKVCLLHEDGLVKINDKPQKP